ncbi:MAG: autotransporter outer membrane beta-barrel domain-containing protein, partial [Desulfuromonadales bacterium]|nr:autotransporter outer membrane beta-barrel domain-containing protein [Desulfuromonadales bacterium]
MNKVFKTIWNETLSAWIPVSEITKAYKTGRKKSRIIISALALGCLLAGFSVPAIATTYTVPDGADIAALYPATPNTIADGDVWNLEGNAIIGEPGAILPRWINGGGTQIGMTGAGGSHPGNTWYGNLIINSDTTLTINGLGSGLSIITVSPPSTATGGPGGIAMSGGGAGAYTVSNITLNLNNVAFENGVSPGLWGAGGTVFGGYWSGGGAGAPYNLQINGDLIAMNNSAPNAVGDTMNGGAVVCGANNVDVAGNATLLGNSGGTAGGGAIYAGGTVTLGSNPGNYVDIENNSAQGGDSSIIGGLPGGGGAIQAGAVILAPAGGNVTLMNNSVLNNSSRSTTNNLGSGGAIYSAGDVSIADGGGNVVIEGNSAVAAVAVNSAQTGVGAQGGAIYAGGNVSVAGNGGDVILANNSAISSGTATGGGAGGGGAIYANTGDITVAPVSGNVTITNNSAIATWYVSSSGGGALLARNGTITVGNPGAIVDIENNYANYQNGTFVGNPGYSTSQYIGYGGAINSGNGMTITGSQITISNNAGTGDGGALVNYWGAGGDIVVNGNLVAQNDIAGQSGGFSSNDVSGGNTILTGGIIDLEQNRAGYTLDGAVLTAGNGGAIYDASGSVILDGNIVTLASNQAGGNGGAIYSGGNVSITGTEISNNTAAGNGGAIYAAGDFNLTSTTIDTITNNSAGSLGGAIWAGGDVDLNSSGGSITFSGNTQGTATAPQANAIYMDNTNGDSALTLNASSGNVITFYDPIQNNAANGLITVTSNGPVTFDGSKYADTADQWSQAYATTNVQSGTFTVDNNAVYGALASDVGGNEPSSFTVQSGATLAGGIMGSVRADAFTLNGRLNITGASPVGTALGSYSTFNITSSNVSLGSGSQTLFNTYLNDASRQLTDLLVLNLNGGTTTGTAKIVINNTNGPGAQTKGNGIELVQTNDGTSTNAFTLYSPVVAGAYQYNLYQGGIGTDANNGNWYLRSNLTNLAKSIIAGSDMVSSWIINDTLLQRMGELRTTDYDQAKHGLQSWVRGYGWQANVNTNNRVNYKSTVYGFDAGTDRTWQFENSQLSTGLFAGMNYDKRRIGNNGQAGHDNIDTISGGIYGTWENQKGYYLDAVGKVGNLDTEINSNDEYYSKATYNIFGILGSLELGKQIRSQKGWYIEPQVQGTYVHFTGTNYTATDNIGGQTKINQKASDSYDIRAGIVAGKRITTETAGILQP